MNISVVIPCYNEADSIAQVLQSLPGVTEVIVVDNNCTDQTAELAKKHGATVVFEQTRGYGAAIKKGLDIASGDYIVVLDGDCQYPAAGIMDTIAHMEENGVDFVSCNRFPLVNKRSMPLVRVFGNWLLTQVANFLFGLDLQDSQSGMWVFKRSVLQYLPVQSNDMPFSQEFKIRAATHASVVFSERVVEYFPRIGESKLFPLRHGFKNLVSLGTLRVQLLRAGYLEGPWWVLGLLAVLGAYMVLAAQNITSPFIHVTEDVNGLNGLAAQNWITFRPWHLGFGIYDHIIFGTSGEYAYLHHPALFLLPTVFMYVLFGVSELTTRLGLLSYMMFAIGLFYYALVRLYGRGFAFLTGLVLVVLPGMVYYGKSFELSVFSIPAALVTFSLYAFYLTSKHNQKLWLGFFFVSILLGGLTTWFYFFFPASLWLYILLTKKDPALNHKKQILWAVPALLLCALGLHILQTYILGGFASLENLNEAYKFRSSYSVAFGTWFRSVFIDRSELNFTAVFLGTALLGVFYFLYNFFKQKTMPRVALLGVFLCAPLLVTVVFYEWITHPFGVMVFAPIVALASGWLMYELSRKFGRVGLLLVCLIFLVGVHASWQNLNFYYDKFLILGPKDVDLLQALSPKVHDGEVCLGQNELGLGYNGITEWYLHKKLGTLDSGCALVLAFRLGVTQESFLAQKQLYQSKGFNSSVYCAEWWCLLAKDKH